MGNAIKISNMFYHDLFEDLNISIENNSFVTISGPNNCGKTTLIRILNRELIVESDIKIEALPINSYSILEYTKLVECIIPKEIIFRESTLEEEMALYNSSLKETDWILKGLNAKKIKDKKNKNLSTKEIILYQLCMALIKSPKIILIDGISPYFEGKEFQDILLFLREYQKKKKCTIVYTTLNLKDSLVGDTLILIDDKKVSLEGNVLEVLQKDNNINKMGLNLPFMVDLSVKLKDYDLLKEIELDMNGMVNTLWK